MPDIQAVLNATALIAGGVITSRPGVYRGAGGIAGVKIAYSLPPEENNLNEDGPAHVSFWDGLEVQPPDGDLTVFKHTIRMQLMLAIGRSEIPRAYALLTPFVPLYFAAFAINLGLKSSCSVSQLHKSPGLVEAIYPDRLALEWFLEVTQKEAITYSL